MTDLRAADGRVPGRRGRATRARLLDCTAEMLATTSFRELKVIDIAREAQTSPATFYQYFPDVESAILVLAEAMEEDISTLVDAVRTGEWRGDAAFESALRLADRFLEFWDRHRSLLRVVELAGGEGDQRFAQLRSRMLRPVTLALADVGRKPDAHPMAACLVAMLANVAAHRPGFEHTGISMGDARRSMSPFICAGII